MQGTCQLGAIDFWPGNLDFQGFCGDRASQPSEIRQPAKNHHRISDAPAALATTRAIAAVDREKAPKSKSRKDEGRPLMGGLGG